MEFHESFFMRVKEAAPITLFVYNRQYHTQRTVEALQQNESAEESDLIIFFDGSRLALLH